MTSAPMPMPMPIPVLRLVPDTSVYFVNVDEAKPDDRVHLSEAHQDVVVWWSGKRQFRVAEVKPVESGAPANPFHREFPMRDFAPVVCSGAAKKNARGHLYKITFEFSDGGKLDPEVAVEV